jgi:hypothetical protein
MRKEKKVRENEKREQNEKYSRFERMIGIREIEGKKYV